MNPATPVTTQILGAETSCSRRRRYSGEMTSSQWKSTRRAESEQRAREHAISIIHAALAASQRRDKASSIPTEPNPDGLISRVSAHAYEFGATPPRAMIHCLVAVLPHSCGGRTTIDLFVSIRRDSGGESLILSEWRRLRHRDPGPTSMISVLSSMSSSCHRPPLHSIYADIILN